MFDELVLNAARKFIYDFNSIASRARYTTLANIDFHLTGSMGWIIEEILKLRKAIADRHAIGARRKNDPILQNLTRRLHTVETLYKIIDIDMSGVPTVELSPAEKIAFLNEVNLTLKQIQGVTIINQKDTNLPFLNCHYAYNTPDGQTIVLDISLMAEPSNPVLNHQYMFDPFTNENVSPPVNRAQFTEKDFINAPFLITEDPYRIFFALKSCVKTLLADKHFTYETASQINNLFNDPTYAKLKKDVFGCFKDSHANNLKMVRNHYPNTPVTPLELEQFILPDVLFQLSKFEAAFAAQLVGRMHTNYLEQIFLTKGRQKTIAHIDTVKANTPAEVSQDEIKKVRENVVELDQKIATEKEKLDALTDEATKLEKTLETNEAEIAGLKQKECDDLKQINALKEEQLQLIKDEIIETQSELDKNVVNVNLGKYRAKAALEPQMLSKRQQDFDTLSKKAAELSEVYNKNKTEIEALKRKNNSDVKIIAQLRKELEELKDRPTPNNSAQKNSHQKESKQNSSNVNTSEQIIIQTPDANTLKLYQFIEALRQMRTVFELATKENINASELARLQHAFIANSILPEFNTIFEDISREKLDEFMGKASKQYKEQAPVLFENLRQLAIFTAYSRNIWSRNPSTGFMYVKKNGTYHSVSSSTKDNIPELSMKDSFSDYHELTNTLMRGIFINSNNSNNNSNNQSNNQSNNNSKNTNNNSNHQPTTNSVSTTTNKRKK